MLTEIGNEENSKFSSIKEKLESVFCLDKEKAE